MERRKRLFGTMALLACILVLPACGEGQREDGILTYAALNPVSAAVQRSIDNFNKSHTDIQIEIRDYSDDGGLDRLRTELILGKVPDIMEMHYLGKSPDRTENNKDPDPRSGNITSWKHQYNDILTRTADEYWMPYRQMA